jgi:hypothetical protein
MTVHPGPSLRHTGLVRILGLVLLLAIPSIGCSAGDSRYDEDVRNNFLVACQDQGDASSCGRALSCIEENLSQDEYEYEESLMLLTGGPSDRMADVMARCISDLD